MSIISPQDYQIAISSGNDQTLVKIPNMAFPIKSTKTARRAANGKKEKQTVSSTDGIRGGSADTGATDETGHRKPNTSNPPRGSFPAVKPAAAKSTPSKMTPSERESSDQDESSDIDELPRPSRDSPIKSPTVKKSKRKSSVDSAAKLPTSKPPPLTKSRDARSSSFYEIDHENPKDEMEDWEIEPGVVAGSGSDDNDDSETENSENFPLAVHVSESLLTRILIQTQPTHRSTSILLKQASNSQVFIFRSFALRLDQLRQGEMFPICESALLRLAKCGSD